MQAAVQTKAGADQSVQCVKSLQVAVVIACFALPKYQDNRLEEVCNTTTAPAIGHGVERGRMWRWRKQCEIKAAL